MAFDFSVSTQALSKEEEVIEADEEEETDADAAEVQAEEEEEEEEPLSAKLRSGARWQAYSIRVTSDAGEGAASDAGACIPEVTVEVPSADGAAEGLLESYESPTFRVRKPDGTSPGADSTSARTATPNEHLMHSCVYRSPWQWPEEQEELGPQLLQMSGSLSTASLHPSPPPWSLDASATGPERAK